MFFFKTKRRRAASVAERVHDERLRRAEAELLDLTVRGDRALRTLDDRHRRNHWREAIEQMIQGAP